MSRENEPNDEIPETIPLEPNPPDQNAPVPSPPPPSSAPKSAFRRICRSRVLWISILILIIIIAALFIGGSFLLVKKEPKLLNVIPNIDDELFYLPHDRKKLGTLALKTHDDLRSYRDLSHIENIVNCTGSEPRDTSSHSCEFNLAKEVSPGCTYAEGFGYFIRQPCVFLQAGRVLDWTPEPYPANGPFPQDTPSRILRDHDENMIYVDCRGELPVDEELLGPIEYTPLGFHTKYFPYRGQPSYQPPLVSLQFRRITPAVAVVVKCRLMARNLEKEDPRGEVSFAILVE